MAHVESVRQPSASADIIQASVTLFSNITLSNPALEINKFIPEIYAQLDVEPTAHDVVQLILLRATTNQNGSAVYQFSIQFQDNRVSQVGRFQGQVGPTGVIGFVGVFGYTGSVATVPSGPFGYIGFLGLRGPPGATGPLGGGPTGPQGPPGVQGPVGPFGPQGSAGITGATGPTGPFGATGPTGPAGPTGPRGSTGPAGTVGAAGAPGATGPAGPANLAGDLAGSTLTQTVVRFSGTGGVAPITAPEIFFSGGVDGNGDPLPATDALRGAIRTTDATANQILSTVTPADGQQIRVISEVMAVRKDVAGQAAWFLLRGVWLRVGGSLTVVKAPEILASGATAGATTWAAQLAAVGTAVQTQVTGEAGKTIHWNLVREWIGGS
jgi:hypothetical protein